MKTYKVKNYKGNLVESLSRFQKKYPGMKICEAVEVNVSEAANTEEQFSIDWDTSNKDATEYFNSETEAKKYWNSVAKKYGIKFWMNFTGSAGGNPEVTFKGSKKNLEKFIFEYLAHGDKKEYAEAVDDINEFNDTDFSKQYNESANDEKELQIKVKEDENDDYDEFESSGDYGEFFVELYKNRNSDPIRKSFDDFKKAFSFADSKAKTKMYSGIFIYVMVAAGPDILSSYDDIHNCWIGRTK